MPDEIQRELLSQAKKYLASSDFENAAKTARGALALDEANSEAADIIKASEAALGQSNASLPSDQPGSPEVPTEQSELASIAARVQALLDSAKVTISSDPSKTTNNLFSAESLLKEFLEKYPENSSAQQILSDVHKAHRDANATIERSYSKNKNISLNARLRTERNIGLSTKPEDSSGVKVPYLLGLIIVVIMILYFLFTG